MVKKDFQFLILAGNFVEDFCLSSFVTEKLAKLFFLVLVL